MANNVLSFPATTGASIDLYIEYDGQLWNGSAFEAIQSAHWTAYAVAMTEQNGTGTFNATMPAAVPPASNYGFIVRQRASTNASPTDILLGSLQTSWDGANLGGGATVIHSGTARG